MSAARFLWRWNVRLLRREWRQHLVIFALILIGVALSIGGVLAAYNLTRPPESDFGNGQFAATTPDPPQLTRALGTQGHPYGTVEQASVGLTGSVARLSVRVIDPDNEVTAPLLALVDGRWPAADDEIAVTDRVAIDGAAAGTTVDFAGRPRLVVGLVENPTDLSDEFALAPSLDGMGLRDEERSVEFLIDAAEGLVDFSTVDSVSISTTDGPHARTAAALAVNVVSAVAMLEIALLVGAGFAVIAQRRSRQFGLLAAAGATPRHVRTAAALAGVVIGLAGAVIGALVGVAIATLLVPSMETTVDHRIDYVVPWWSVVPTVALAVAVAAVVARWPTRALSKLPVSHMLASLRPRPAPTGRAALVGVVLTGLGAVALGVGFSRLSLPLAMVGAVVAPVGLLLMSPLLVSVIGRLSAGLPMAPRMAARAISRHGRRSAAVVAALALALSIPVGTAVVTSSLDERRVADGPNIPEGTFIAWLPGAEGSGVRIPADLDAAPQAETVAALARAVPDLDLVPLEMAVSPGAHVELRDFDGIGTAPAVEPVVAARPGDSNCFSCDTFSYGDQDEGGNEIVFVVEDAWVATPPLLDALAIDASWFGNAPAVAKSEEFGFIDISGLAGASERTVVDPSWPNNSDIPSVLLSRDFAAENYDLVPIGWFGSADGPLDGDSRADVRAAVGSNLRIEFHEVPQPQSGLRRAGLLIGLIVGLGIALSAVGLLAVELTDDLAVLESIGASRRTARALTAAIAAILAAAGAAVAILIGYLPLVPLLSARDADFPFVVPWATLTGFVVLFPLLAAAAGWLAARATAVDPAVSQRF